ncbi:DUF2061 domain-containing protein [Winogradskyella arenosi]|uniref:Putative membrane protein n=1 Tax=Winogradskyella arenosi TaxID=533325 RepID=A0A368ZBT7_9FLAO|nr:DUF2061 domain-containing protein [Winogradskyella arenosi]RCW90269.1 putative membrane protein [Winogradskyella arenosi]
MKLSKRHIAKTITWRIIGTLDTFLLSWFISGNIELGSQIAFMELITKMVLYYLHERIWFKSKIKSSNKRHILKTFSWRAVGTVDTFVLGWIVTGNPLIGLKIGGAEVVTKMLLYFVHEKFWYRIDFGLDKRKKRQELKDLKSGV